jgi:hypothetical protein
MFRGRNFGTFYETSGSHTAADGVSTSVTFPRHTPA